MELRNVRVEASPLEAGRARLVGDLAYDDRPGQVEPLWFDVPEEHAAQFSRSGNPWLACLAPVAMQIGEALRLPLPVDRLLRRNVHELMVVWRGWYPELHRIEVSAPPGDGKPEPQGRRTAAFFSGGVDSFFTVLRSREAGALPVDDLIAVGGFDIRLSNLAAFQRRRLQQQGVARSLGHRYVDVITNLRDTRVDKAGWGRLLHGSALAAVGLALEGSYRRLLVASTGDYGSLIPLGSHPLTDPLSSTSSTLIVHDGATHDRRQKLEYIAASDVALENLYVCFRVASDYNCGACEKCMRTMTVLDLLGVLERARSFPIRRVDPGSLARVYIRSPLQQGYYRSIVELARERGRPEIARAVERALRRSRWRRRALPLAKAFANRPGFWRASGPLQRLILKGEIF